MIGIWLLVGCFDTEPTKIQSQEDVPTSLSKEKCPAESVFVEKDKEQFCLMKCQKTTMARVCLLLIKEESIAINMEEVEVPWFVHAKGELDVSKTEAFILNLSLALLQSAQEGFLKTKTSKRDWRKELWIPIRFPIHPPHVHKLQMTCFVFRWRLGSTSLQ